MSRDPYVAPAFQSGYIGDDEQTAAADRNPNSKRDARSAGENRGAPAEEVGSDEAVGSGAGAGGGGSPEEYDSDPQAGGGTFKMKHKQHGPATGADASKHGSR